MIFVQISQTFVHEDPTVSNSELIHEVVDIWPHKTRGHNGIASEDAIAELMFAKRQQKYNLTERWIEMGVFLITTYLWYWFRCKTFE